jgi:uncharacterized caspase-like protein
MIVLLLMANFPWIPSFGQTNPGPPALTQPVAAPSPAPSGTKATTLDEQPINRPVRDKWALVVGIGKYANGKVPKLKFAAKDARDFRNFLVNEANFAPDHVRLILDEDATQRRVVSELGNKFLARVTRPDDVVVLYFSSHGSPAQLDIKGKNFLVAHDSDPDDLYATGINMDNILEMARDRIDSQRVLLVLDACHSGVVSGGEKGVKRPANFDAEQFAQGSGKLIICSSNPEESSWESKRYDNGIFTRKLLEGLRMNGKRTTLGEAFPFIQNAVAAEAQEDYAARQNPVVKSKWSGNELVLAVPAAAPQAVPVSVKQELQPDSTVPSNRPSAFAAGSVQKNLAYEKGVQLLGNRKYEEAIASFSAALKQPNVDKWDVYLNLGEAHSKLGNRFEATKYWKLCIKEKPSSLAARHAELQMRVSGAGSQPVNSYSAYPQQSGTYNNSSSRYQTVSRDTSGTARGGAVSSGSRMPTQIVNQLPSLPSLTDLGPVNGDLDQGECSYRITKAESNQRAAEARLQQVKTVLQPYFNSYPDECRVLATPFETLKNKWASIVQFEYDQQAQMIQAGRNGQTFRTGVSAGAGYQGGGSQQNCPKTGGSGYGNQQGGYCPKRGK